MDSVRIDKWLWCARFFKTRGLASEAVGGGKVQLNGARVKPAKGVRPGDRLVIHKGPYEWIVTVEGLAEKRVSARLAAQLYQETEASQAARAELVHERKVLAAAAPRPVDKPDKRQRRQLARLRGRD